MSDERIDPIAQAKLLAENPPKEEEDPVFLAPGAGKGSRVYKVSLGENAGMAVLEWETEAVGKYDWVGLYPKSGGDWNTYLTGQWQWVEKSERGSYKTGTKLKHGLQARYNIWDYGLGAYKTVTTST